MAATQIGIKQVSGLLAALQSLVPSTTFINTGVGLTGGGQLLSSLTISVTGNLLAIANLSGVGLVSISNTNLGVSAATVTLIGGSGRISITNGSGSLNPTVDLTTTGIVPGTYFATTVDTYGRVTGGNNPTTLAGFGITDAISVNGGTLIGVTIYSTSLGLSIPTTNTRSVGTRVVIYPSLTSSSVDYALGVANNAMWISLPTNTISNTLQIFGGSTVVSTFDGAGNLSINGTLTASVKSFLIPHPTKKNRKLQYSSLEGPENGVYIRGVGAGLSITLPSYWRKLVDPNSITVSITSTCKYRFWVKLIKDNTVFLETDTLMYLPNTMLHAPYTGSYHYIVFAERADVPKLIVERKA